MRFPSTGVAAVLIASSLLGCGGGGPSGDSPTPTPQQPPAPVMQVLPATYDFGRVTSGNSSAPLEVTIRNTGTATLNVSSISLSGGTASAFSLALAGGADPCGSGAPVIGAGDSCTFRVEFQPPANGAYSTSVQIASNDSRTPSFGLPVSGSREAVTGLTVRINQVDTMCPSSNAARAYVSVTDQGGFPVSGLGAGAFQLTEGSTVLPVTLAGGTRPIAIAALVDNSGSIVNQPVAYNDMKTGFASLFNSLRANDVGELINFGSVFEVTVPFPSPSNPANPTNKSALLAGLSVPWSGGTNTLLFDTLYKAIDDAGLQTGYRRAIVVATDGADDQGGTGVPASTRTQAEVIANAVAKGVPIFAIGIGTTVRTPVLQALTSQTGGVYYRANTSQNLATIYQQLSSLLMQSQYELAFNQLSAGTAGVVSPLSLTVTAAGTSGTASSTITSCN